MDLTKCGVSRSSQSEDTVVDINGVKLGGDNPLVIIAGPCAIEPEIDMVGLARILKSMGVHIVRGGCYKPRTSPHDFQGMGLEGLKRLKQAGTLIQIPTASEITKYGVIGEVMEHVDLPWIGSRNGVSYGLIEDIGEAAVEAGKPIMLKRSRSSDVDELIGAAEYLWASGCKQIAICLRGIKTYSETDTRNTLDVDDISEIKEKTHLPVIYDPSHATGRRDRIEEVAIRAVENGADGLMIECHPNPDEADCDSKQQIIPATLQEIIQVANRTYRGIRG